MRESGTDRQQVKWGRHSDKRVGQTGGWDGQTDRFGWTARQVVGTCRRVGQTEGEVGQVFRQEGGTDSRVGQTRGWDRRTHRKKG